ncbi:unnamed protein product [Rotaria sp. Silwood1]|nr:unnamed protein product [Rotaria sp. Silwood1]
MRDTVLVTTTQNQTTFQCRKLILAIPPSQIIPIQFEPMLPGYKREMFKHMPIGSYLKFIFIFDKAFWREDGLSGEVISDGSFAPFGLSIGPMTLDLSPRVTTILLDLPKKSMAHGNLTFQEGSIGFI